MCVVFRKYHEKQSKAFSLLLEKLTEVDVWLKLLEDELSVQTNSPDNDTSALGRQADRCQVTTTCSDCLHFITAFKLNMISTIIEVNI